jgi:hypothetical protein
LAVDAVSAGAGGAVDAVSGGASRAVTGGGSTGEDAEVGGAIDVVPGFGAKAHLTVTIDFQDLKAATANATGQLVYGAGLSAATIRRLACDAKIIPLVLGANSEPLDVGRSQRLITRAMRRALNARDKGCVVCGAPPIMCDAHHLVSWIDGGETKVSNLALLCRRHHVDLHKGRWTITITNGVVHVAPPTWAEPPPRHAHRFRRRAIDPFPDSPDSPDSPGTPGTPGTPGVSTPPANPWATPPGITSEAMSAAPSATGGTGSRRGGDAVVPIARHSKWQADEAVLQDAADFALIDASAGKAIG